MTFHKRLELRKIKIGTLKKKKKTTCFLTKNTAPLLVMHRIISFVISSFFTIIISTHTLKA